MVNKINDDRNASRAKILDAARAEFSEKGFDGARVDEIARRAEVNKALIYYYFKGKDELLQELLRGFLEERRNQRPTRVTDPNLSDLPSQIAQFDVAFLFERRDILRIALMEDLKSSREGFPGSGTILKHWLDGLVAARDDYDKAGFGFRITPRTLTAMYFFHLMPLLSFCSMGETLAKASGQELSTIREEFLKLLLEQNGHHFHSVFSQSCTDPAPEIALPGLAPRAPSDLLAQVGRAFRDGETYEAAQAQSILARIAPDPSGAFAHLIGHQFFKLESGGRFRWCGPRSEPAAEPSRKPPQDHLAMTTDERNALVAKHMPHGRLAKFPLKEKARLAVIEHISSLFRPDTVYTEKQVDTLLKTVVDDHPKARRYLIDYRYLHRKPDGSAYWTWDCTTHDDPSQ